MKQFTSVSIKLCSDCILAKLPVDVVICLTLLLTVKFINSPFSSKVPKFFSKLSSCVTFRVSLFPFIMSKVSQTNGFKNSKPKYLLFTCLLSKLLDCILMGVPFNDINAFAFLRISFIDHIGIAFSKQFQILLKFHTLRCLMRSHYLHECYRKEDKTMMKIIANTS